jgi:D-ala D-ala ligase C-terminus
VGIEPVGGSYDYSARYTPGAAAFACPARLDGTVLKALEEAALAAHQLLGLRDVSRTDAIVDAAGRVQILEVNVSPGLTETSCRRSPPGPPGWSWASCTRRSWNAPFHVKPARRPAPRS